MIIKADRRIKCMHNNKGKIGPVVLSNRAHRIICKNMVGCSDLQLAILISENLRLP